MRFTQKVKSNLNTNNKLLIGAKGKLTNMESEKVQKLYDKNGILFFDLEVIIVTAAQEKEARIKNKLPEL